jgi:hypothetical protein
MSEETPIDLDALIHAEVELAVAQYVGKVPAIMIPKIRELTERYWRETPAAMQYLQRRLKKAPLRSGTEAIDPQADRNEGDLGKEEA